MSLVCDNKNSNDDKVCPLHHEAAQTGMGIFQGDLLPAGEAPRAASSSSLLPLPLGLGLRSALGLGLRSALGLGLRSPLGLGLRPLAAGLRLSPDGLLLRLLLLLVSLPLGLSPRSEPLPSPLSFGGGLIT